MRPLTQSSFEQPEAFLSGVNARVAADLLTAACDVTIALDAERCVIDVAFGAGGPKVEGWEAWRGVPVDECVTVESLPKLRQLLDGEVAPGRWRQVNHPTPSGEDVPVQYTAVPALNGEGWLLLGRDLSAVAKLQSRLVGTQQNLERDYARLRQLETRYQMLFRNASEGLLVVETGSRRIVEANPAAGRLLGRREGSLTRGRFPVGLDRAGTAAAEEMLAGLRGAGRAEPVVVLTESGDELELEAALFRGDGAQLALVSIAPQAKRPASAPDVDRRVIALVSKAAEGVVLTDRSGTILWTNDAFLELVQVAVPEQIRGESLDGYFARPGVDLAVMQSNAREHGRLRFFATSLSGVYGGTTAVDVSAVAVEDRGFEGFGFIFRDSSLEQKPAGGEETPLPRSVEHLKALIGRMPLKEIVRETTDVIERLCIQTALHMTRDNRASAAELLGLSRQSLYVKLRRHGLGDLGPEEERV